MFAWNIAKKFKSKSNKGTQTLLPAQMELILLKLEVRLHVSCIYRRFYGVCIYAALFCQP